MLVLSTRLHDKILFPETNTAVEVVAIQGATIRLGISAPDDVRVLREELPVKASEWEPEPALEELPSLDDLKGLIDKRLDITRKGINQARQCLRDGRNEDARVLLEMIDEDLHLLRRRVHREVELIDMPCGMVGV